jgi:hypothetical protein
MSVYEKYSASCSANARGIGMSSYPAALPCLADFLSLSPFRFFVRTTSVPPALLNVIDFVQMFDKARVCSV